MKNDTALGQTTRSLARRTLQRAVWVLGLAFGLLAGTAHAALHFGFSVDFAGGALDGQTAIGSLTVAEEVAILKEDGEGPVPLGELHDLGHHTLGRQGPPVPAGRGTHAPQR